MTPQADHAARFRARYGPWALVAGGSEGIGAAFARILAGRGIALILVARRSDVLEPFAAELRATYGVEVLTAALDLGQADLGSAVDRVIGDREIGLLVYNAATSVIGPFLDHPVERHLQVIDVNCRGPLLLSHHLGRQMRARGRGGIILMTSLAAGQGSPYIASYAASKAFDLVLAEGLWLELARHGVDVLACRAGATRTPAYERSGPDFKGPIMEPGKVAEEALEALGRRPSMVSGRFNRFAAFLMGRVLTRRAAVRMFGRTTAKIYRLG